MSMPLASVMKSFRKNQGPDKHKKKTSLTEPFIGKRILGYWLKPSPYGFNCPLIIRRVFFWFVVTAA